MMDFYEVLDQVIDLLRQHGRVTYRALKRQFDIDDEYLEDLRDEIIEARQLAVDQDGRLLMWTGSTESAPSISESTDTQPVEPAVTQETQSTQIESLPTESHTPDAERRQLTVMFCDLVSSTSLSSELDPEDYREVVRQYQRVCAEVISRYDGYIAQYLGDGLLVYFGFPQAHEDDAQRAVRSGLGIIEAIETLNARLEQDKGVELAIRLGIHTGLVVVGEIGEDGRQEQLALGETPNLAARIQGVAEPNTLVISAATYRLVQGYFDCDFLGEHDLRGIVQPIVVYRVLQESGVQSRLDIESTRGLTPLVGRESEVTLLLERWSQVRDGQSQVVLVSGEAGIGKSRLVQVLKDHVVNEPHIRLECRSSPYFQNTALYPIIDLMQRTLRWEQAETADEKLNKLEQALSQYRLPIEESVPLMAGLLSLALPEDRYPPLNSTPQRQRQKTLETIVAIILELAEGEPVLFILEDLHWIDPSTLELLDLLVDQTPTASIYALLTCRPEFQAQWANRSYFTQITLNRLSRNGIEQMATKVAREKTLPDEVLQQLVAKTDGVPLYVEEMTKAVLESGVLKETDGHYELVGSVAPLAIPATLQDSLMARLDRLVTAKGVAQYASVIGRQFSYELLRDVSPLDEALLQRELGRLVDAELVYQQGLPPQATYMFKHALIQDIAYESLLRSTRQGYHRRIAEVLEEQFPETADNQPELLAHHCTEAGLNEQAVDYWQQAGEQAVQRSAHAEAINHFKNGQELLQQLPDTLARTQQELALCTNLGVALVALKGQGDDEVESVFIRARELCQQVGETLQLLPILWGLFRFYFARAEYAIAYELAEKIMRLASSAQEPALLLEAHRGLGVMLFCLGDLPTARAHLEQSIALYNPQLHQSHAILYGQDPSVVCRCYLSWTLWLLGYPDQALTRSQEALRYAQALSHPHTLAFALDCSAGLHQLRREALATRQQAEAAIKLSTDLGFVLFATLGTILGGWGQGIQGETEVGIAHIHQGLASWRVIGAEFFRTCCLCLLAQVYEQAGQTEAGLDVLSEAQSVVETTGERFYEPELYRLKGQLLLQQSPDNATEATACFHQAISIAQNQSAKSWELRASTSLAKLWQQQDKRQEAYDLLAPVYNWFTEGFDTADLQEAKRLLGDLS
jgi:TOMM system kinase/cyclase fusion protein